MLSKLELLSKRINTVIQEAQGDKEVLNKVLEILGSDLNGTAILVNDEYDAKLNAELKGISILKTNIKLDNIKFREYNSLVLPINVQYVRIGTVLVYKKNHNFSAEDIFLLEVVSGTLTLLAKHIRKEEERQTEIAKRAISILSFSELEAVFCIFDEIQNGEGLLVASKVADSAGITRSVIGNGIKKLESSDVIETRSLGMKGTFIKITNPKIVEEIDKMRG